MSSRSGVPKQRALLCVLLLRANEVVATARLVDELWGERPPATAVKTVQVHVSQLRKLLGEDGDRDPADRVPAAPRAGGARSGAVRGVVRAGPAAARGGRSRGGGRGAAEALGLWRGPPLADFELEAFARNEIARLDGLRLACLELRLRVDLALGRHSEVVGELSGLVASIRCGNRCGRC